MKDDKDLREVLEKIPLAERTGWTEDRCLVCGTLIGVGLPIMHIGMCDTCREKKPH